MAFFFLEGGREGGGGEGLIPFCTLSWTIASVPLVALRFINLDCKYQDPMGRGGGGIFPRWDLVVVGGVCGPNIEIISIDFLHIIERVVSLVSGVENRWYGCIR